MIIIPSTSSKNLHTNYMFDPSLFVLFIPMTLLFPYKFSLLHTLLQFNPSYPSCYQSNPLVYPFLISFSFSKINQKKGRAEISSLLPFYFVIYQFVENITKSQMRIIHSFDNIPVIHTIIII